MRKTVLWGVAVGAAAGAITWVYGVQGIRPFLVAVGVIAVAIAFRGFENATYRSWPEREPLVAGGGTITVARLAPRMGASTGRRRGPDAGVTLSLRRLVSLRLARRGLTLTDPRADAHLAPGVRQALLDDNVPDQATLSAVLTSIERLDATTRDDHIRR